MFLFISMSQYILFSSFFIKRNYKAGTCVAIVGNGREENRNNAYPHAASLAQPSGLAIVQELKAVFFADSESSTIRRVHMEDGKVSAVAGADRNPAVFSIFSCILKSFNRFEKFQ